MIKFEVQSIGEIHVSGEEMYLELSEKYIPGLTALEGFSHLEVIWWFSDFDTEEARAVIEVPQPYKNAPEVVGVFATRSPVRPNPIALTTVQILSIDHRNGRVYFPYIDANDGTPVLDLKPYTPSIDRVEHPGVPEWCSHWPKSYETSGEFDWEGEMAF